MGGNTKAWIYLGHSLMHSVLLPIVPNVATKKPGAVAPSHFRSLTTKHAVRLFHSQKCLHTWKLQFLFWRQMFLWAEMIDWLYLDSFVELDNQSSLSWSSGQDTCLSNRQCVFAGGRGSIPRERAYFFLLLFLLLLELECPCILFFFLISVFLST